LSEKLSLLLFVLEISTEGFAFSTPKDEHLVFVVNAHAAIHLPHTVVEKDREKEEDVLMIADLWRVCGAYIPLLSSAHRSASHLRCYVGFSRSRCTVFHFPDLYKRSPVDVSSNHQPRYSPRGQRCSFTVLNGVTVSISPGTEKDAERREAFQKLDSASDRATVRFATIRFMYPGGQGCQLERC